MASTRYFIPIYFSILLVRTLYFAIIHMAIIINVAKNNTIMHGSNPTCLKYSINLNTKFINSPLILLHVCHPVLFDSAAHSLSLWARSWVTILEYEV